MSRDMRNVDVRNMKMTSGQGVNPQDNSQLKPGAKDGLSGTNVTEAFSKSIDVSKMGPWGGENKNK